jgi:hypothetical protein
VRRRGTAAAAHDVDQAICGELADDGGHLLRCLVVAAELVGQACVRVAADERVCRRREVFQVCAEFPRPQCAVEAYREEVGVMHGDPEGLGRLT